MLNSSAVYSDRSEIGTYFKKILFQTKRSSFVTGRRVDEKLAQLLTETTVSTTRATLPRRLLSDTLSDLELVREVKEAMTMPQDRMATMPESSKACQVGAGGRGVGRAERSNPII